MLKQESWSKIINLLSDLVIFNSYNFEEFLKKLNKLIIKIVPVNSCLIYFYDREKKEAKLVSSRRPHEKLIGKINLKAGEGITGWVVTHKKTVVLEKYAYKDERFKFFKELPEDRYEAFLSVPIIDRVGVVGVINLQHKLIYKFSSEQVKTVEAVVKIVASAFEKIVLDRRIDQLENKLEERKLIERAKGILMKEKKMTEDEAYKLIRQEAMKKRKSMRDIAQALILIY